MIAEHADAVLGALKTSPPFPVFDGPVAANTAPPYQVVYVSVTTPEAVSMEEAADLVTTTAIVHSVGGSGAAVRNVADRAAGILIGFRPEIAGRDCGRVRLIDSQPAAVNEETGQRILNQVDTYRFTSVPG